MMQEMLGLVWSCVIRLVIEGEQWDATVGPTAVSNLTDLPQPTCPSPDHGAMWVRRSAGLQRSGRG